MDDCFEFLAGSTPLLVSIPHAGTRVPDAIAATLTESARQLPDTDWHLDQLWDFVTQKGAAKLQANYSRYVVDLNRPPDDERLYTTATTGLFPTEQFDGQPIYREGLHPDHDEQLARIERYYKPYHAQLSQTLQTMQQQFGFAVLFDAHSILSRVPRLFDGQLPDLNIGTNDGQSAPNTLTQGLIQLCNDSPFSTIVNGRFKGGHITRHYGQPKNGVYAVQLEMAQSTYMREVAPESYDPTLARRVLPTLERWIERLIQWSPQKDGS